jgi:hypothetical protein
VPAIAFGGAMLLRLIWGREPGYLDNPIRQNLWRAGHAHAGVLVILALVGMYYIDRTDYSGGLSMLVRVLLVQAPILMPLGFFLSVASPQSERPKWADLSRSHRRPARIDWSSHPRHRLTHGIARLSRNRQSDERGSDAQTEPLSFPSS